MLHNFMALVPAALGSPRGSRFGRTSQPRGETPTQEDLGKWIWIGSPDPVSNSYIQARKMLSLGAKPATATIKACADSRYKLFVNGRYVGKGPVRAPEGYCYFDTHDIAEFLTKGKNVIAFLVHHIGENTYSSPQGRPGLICKAEIETNGETQSFGTDETWKVRRAAEWLDGGARLSHGLGFQEAYDMAGTADGWTEVKFNEKGWESAVVVGNVPSLPWGDLLPREIPQLREQTILPVAVVATSNSAEVVKDTPIADMPNIMANSELTPLKAGAVDNADALLRESDSTHVRTPRGDRGVVIVLDFGREVFGDVEIGIASSGIGCADIGYGEALLDGRVKPNAGDTRFTDRILLKKGRLDWQSFEPRAFRFLQIEFRRCSKVVSLEHIRVNQTTYPVEQTGHFECSDDLINEIWKAGVYTAQLCMEDTYIDSPFRERAQWWADARVTSRTAYYAFNDTALLAQGLRQIGSSQGKDGSILGLYPTGADMLVPDYALLWVFSILDHYAFSDDDSLIHELYPAVQRLMKWFAHYENDSGLLAGVPGRLLVDRADLERTGEVTSLNCFYHQALRVASALASIAGKPEDAQEYIDSANRLRVALNKYMYLPRRGLYAECRVDGKLMEKFSRQTNILAALFDVADQYQKGGIFRQLSSGTLPEVATPYFASYYLEALYSADQHEEALTYLRRRWGEMIKSGSSTLWEDFTTEGSLCHGSSVCPTRDLIAEYVGIKPVLGTHRFSVTPHSGGLRWARGAVQTASGPLTVDWRTIRNRLDIAVEVPDDLKVDVYPPGPLDSTITVDGKPWPSRFITLSGGSHIVRVTAPRSEKISTYDEALTPLMPHVEVLDRGIRVSRGRSIVLETRKRTRRSMRFDEPIEVRMDAATMGEETEEEEISEQFQPAAESAEEATQKRRRRPRGGRGRSRTAAEQPAETEAAPTALPSEAEAVPTAEEPQPETAGEETPKRRRRSRGGRGRRRSTAAEPVASEEALPPSSEQMPSEQPEPISAEPAAAEETPAPKRRRRPRGGRGRGRSSAQGETATPESAPSEEVPEAVEHHAEPEATQPEPQAGEEAAPKRRRRPRGGRGRGRSSAQTETATPDAAPSEEAPQAVEHHAEPTATQPEPQVGEEAAPKRRRRPRGGRGRGKSATSEEQSSPESSSEPQAAAEPTPAPEPQPEPTAEEPKKRRRTYTRRKTTKSTEDQPTDQSGEA